MSWFRSSRRRLSERETDAGPESLTGDGDGALATELEPAGDGADEAAAPAAAMPRAELEGRPLADLHAYAREHAVPRYRLLRREELIRALSGSGPADVAEKAPPTERQRKEPEPVPEPSPAIEVSEVTEVSVDLLDAVQHLVRQLSSSARAPGASELEEIVASPATRLLVANSDGELVGMLTLALFRIPTGVRAWIEDVVVDERARGHGAGQALTREAMRLATDAGARTVDLTSRRERQAANRMYRKLGFQRRETTVYRIEP